MYCLVAIVFKNESRSISRVLYSCERWSLISDNVLPPVSLASYPPTRFLLAKTFRASSPIGVGLHGIAARSVAVSSIAGAIAIVAVPGTKHFCLQAVNLYGALCCPDFPLRLHVATNQSAFRPQKYYFFAKSPNKFAQFNILPYLCTRFRGFSTSVVHQLPKLRRRVRLP